MRRHLQKSVARVWERRTKGETKTSKKMAYLLRHNPSGMSVSEEGFVDLDELLKKLRKRWKNLSREDLRKLVDRDPKGSMR